MKTYLTLGILFTAVTAAFASPDTDAIKAKETAAWEAFKTKDAASFQKLLAPEMRAVSDKGAMTIKDELASMQKMAMTSYTISDFNAVEAAPDTIVTTYTVATKAMMDGKDISSSDNAGSVWRKVNGEWLAVFHTDMSQAAAR